MRARFLHLRYVSCFIKVDDNTLKKI